MVHGARNIICTTVDYKIFLEIMYKMLFRIQQIQTSPCESFEFVSDKFNIESVLFVPKFFRERK
jgi:hypothetical protein